MDKSILWLSDGAQLTTGYCTISRKLMNYLVDYGWKVDYLSHTGNHQTFMPGLTFEDGEKLNFKIHGAGLAPYCQDLIVPKIHELKPKIFGILLDTFMCYPWFLNLDFSPAKSLFYFPSDGGGFPVGCEQILKKVDVPVAMSKYAQKQVKELFNINSKYIPHAVETDVYKPLSEQEKLVLRNKWGLRGKFVIGCVARNQGRKMLDRQMLSFAKVCKEMPNAVFLMHTDKQDPASYFNFEKLINDLGIQNRVIFTGTRYFKGFDYKKMNEIYNLMDIFFLSTSGEGFGIPFIEAMSAGVPVITTDYTTAKEIIEDNNAGILVKCSDEILGTWHVNRGIMDINEGTKALIKLYNEPLTRKEMGLNGRSAVLRDYDWRIVSKEWDKLLTEMLND